MLTLSIIKADTGGFVGHTAVHPAMVAHAAHAIERVRGGLLIDGQIATEAKLVRRAHPDALRELVFDAGSMGPKVEAALDFATSGEGWAAIGAMEDAAAVLRGDAGARTSVRAEGLELIPPGWSASP